MVVDRETLTPNQAARRTRVLDAALALAAEGGYDAVQMRDVAGRAQVALGTIYRYFSSKDHLLAACQVELWKEQSDRLAAHPPEGARPSERVQSVIGRAMRGALREPQRTAALITACSTPDPAVRECQREIMDIMDRVLAEAMGDVDPGRRERIAITLRQVWFSWLLNWVNGWNDAETVTEQIDSTIELLLD
jgi:TetR/AcrR family transcriptional regulator, cholesterol catabolism regulator